MDPLTRASEQAYGEMLGPHFIDLEEIIDVNEELQEEQDIKCVSQGKYGLVCKNM